ncbi:hypothetical protein BS17DRAFT_775678 [Gyrodon lividus]|nr:hypothetical protein BS17DRAFT_775678 [Gyrodon lividus]
MMVTTEDLIEGIVNHKLSELMLTHLLADSGKLSSHYVVTVSGNSLQPRKELFIPNLSL